MKNILIFLIIFGITLEAKLEDHFKKPTDKSGSHQMEGIDFIYMLNLDQRPEKYERSAGALAVWGIEPYRFSAVNGWELTVDAVTDVGIKYKPSMTLGEKMATYYEEEQWPKEAHEYPHKEGRTYFCHCMSRGAIGCCLSHLSILQDAYDSGYETIWVMEDDIQVIRDPHILSDLIKKLDKTVGKNGWDILFTDRDSKNNNGEYVPCGGFALRLNYMPSTKRISSRKTKADPEIKRIKARYGTYSMIIRRSGMQKLLAFFKKYNLFLPMDMELGMPNRIRLFAVMDDVVSTVPNSPSDNGAPYYLNPVN